MKTIRRFAITLALVAAAALPSRAQNNTYTQGGILLASGSFTPLDMMRNARNDYSFTTARVSAMGGAFTALGGDLASLDINPAGIGMSQHFVLGLSAGMTFSRGNNELASRTATSSRFTFNNAGMILPWVRSNNGRVCFNVGFSYNRTDDFNFGGNIRLPQVQGGSLLNVFQLQLNGLYSGWKGISEQALKDDPFNNTDIFIDEWGAVLGYQSGLFQATGDGTYALNALPSNATFTPSLNYQSTGSVGEYNIAGGFNFSNVVYFGFDLGFQSIAQNMWLSYTEEYTGAPSLNRMSYSQRIRANGTSFNIKLGAIIRPIPSLRIGIAYHSPNFTSLYKDYMASMETLRPGQSTTSVFNTLQTTYLYEYQTPSRLLLGAAYTLGSRVALSFDYERVWYNGMRYTSESYAVQESFRSEIRSLYRAANNFRVGVEVKPIPSIALRAGYAYYDSPIKERDEEGNPVIFNDIFTTSSHHVSAGVGFWLGPATTLDLTYVYSRYRVSPFGLYYYEGAARLPEGTVNQVTFTPCDVPAGVLNRHSAILTLSFLF